VGVRDDAVACIEPVAAPAELRPVTEPGGEPLVCYAGNLDGYQNLGIPARGVPAHPRGRADGPLVLVTHADAQANAARLVAGGAEAGVGDRPGGVLR
jgi:hypothetical protein